AGGRRFALTRAAEIVGQVTPIETGFCHVRLSADVRNLRRARLGGATFLVSLGAVATVASTMIGVLAPYAMAPAAAFGIAATAVLFAGRRQQLEQIEVGMEQVLDRLERGEIRPEHALPGPRASAFVRIAEEIRKQFQF
ncbi:MAG TPA: hypothetical protein VIW26_14815, partial [Gemmatimonadales bacterium]